MSMQEPSGHEAMVQLLRPDHAHEAKNESGAIRVRANRGSALCPVLGQHVSPNRLCSPLRVVDSACALVSLWT
ncbi:unnamed protein product [Protopolystoma xenopodis]|uniref:Uncharacterized protein n=1 Tax=Protopolystoma xenopodis TaxID=117903 RepID=A0A3S5A2U9_9PLAT|nr:unnamed protein product [Protopolystoma xenopodis]